MDKKALFQQVKRALVIAKKDIRIYYLKGPVVIFGILFPLFLFLSFAVGRNLGIEFMMPGFLGMVLFFTATAISPAVAPMETQLKTLERLMSCPVTLPTIILGDVLASFAFGIVISLIPLMVGLGLGISIYQPVVLGLGMILAAFCFSALGLLFSVAPTSNTSTIMMLSSMVKFPVVFISGIFIPLTNLPDWGKAIAFISPLTYFTDLARHCLQTSGHLPVWVDLGALLTFAAVFLILALKLHQKTMPRRV
ncbi:MAG: ABC transporter permease [Dehalococcoidaceae bacterium]|nr:ABC transporter permease [Dehalococcoidaceae bacterium]